MNVDQHIAFLENQRSPKDKSTLRIPSPREFDRGGKPEDVGDEENAILTRKVTSRPRFGSADFGKALQTANRITINEPKIARSRDRNGPFPRVDSGKTGSRASSAASQPQKSHQSQYHLSPIQRRRSQGRRTIPELGSYHRQKLNFC